MEKDYIVDYYGCIIFLFMRLIVLASITVKMTTDEGTEERGSYSSQNDGQHILVPATVVITRQWCTYHSERTLVCQSAPISKVFPPDLTIMSRGKNHILIFSAKFYFVENCFMK